MSLSKKSRAIVVAGLVVTSLLSIFFVTTLKESEMLPDRYANMDYSFSYPDIAEKVDKSKELKAWIGYDEEFLDRPFAWNIVVNKKWLPNRGETQFFLDNYPVLERVISERGEEWVSYETARSLVEDYWKNGHAGGHCGQYKYIQTYMLPLLGSNVGSNDEIVFIPIVLPKPDAVCFPDRLMEEAYGPLLGTPSIEQPRSLDFVKILEVSSDFGYSNLLLLTLTPIVLLGVLIWRGTVRRTWLINGFSYYHFELMVKMRGSKTRLEILKTLETPKTRQMIAQELNIDWKAVDRHVEVMLKSDLIKEVCNVARASYYARSEKGDKLLELLNNERSSNNNDLGMLSIALFVRRKITNFYRTQN